MSVSKTLEKFFPLYFEYILEEKTKLKVKSLRQSFDTYIFLLKFLLNTDLFVQVWFAYNPVLVIEMLSLSET